jgi:hypothetical protein
MKSRTGCHSLPPHHLKERRAMANDDLHPLDLRRIPRNLPSDQYKLGDEFKPFHPQASHIPPGYRDGWNRCWLAARAASPQEAPSALHTAGAAGPMGDAQVMGDMQSKSPKSMQIAADVHRDAGRSSIGGVPPSDGGQAE